ncbi:MAG: hypothetical protein JW969_01410 [Spirochaetales bacterium]|nr:hypothetical protein [Spirochaetales bacterium]
MDFDINRRALFDAAALNYERDYETDIAGWVAEIIESGFFEKPSVSRYKCNKSYTVEEYIGLFNTFSDFLKLPETKKNRIETIIRTSLRKLGGTILKDYESVLIHGKKNPS